MTFAAAFEDNFCKCWIHFFFISFFTSDIFRPHFFFWILIRIVDTTTHREMQGSGKTVLSVKKFYCTLHRSISTYLLSRCHFGILSPACSLISSLLTQIITHNTTSKDFIDNIDVFLWVHKASNALVSKTPTTFNLMEELFLPLDMAWIWSIHVCLKRLSVLFWLFLLMIVDTHTTSFCRAWLSSSRCTSRCCLKIGNDLCEHVNVSCSWARRDMIF